MALDDWKSLLEVLELLLKCAAIVAAGLWAAYTFGSLGQIARAKADIAKTEAERRRAEAEIERLSEQGRVGAVIQIRMTPRVETLPNDPGKYLSVTAEVTNSGTRNAQIDYPKPPEAPFTAYAVTADAGGGLSYERVAAAQVVSGVNPRFRSKRLLVRAGGTERLSFFTRVPGAGLYLLVISVPVSEREQEVARQFGFEAQGRWSAKQFFVVS